MHTVCTTECHWKIELEIAAKMYVILTYWIFIILSEQVEVQLGYSFKYRLFCSSAVVIFCSR